MPSVPNEFAGTGYLSSMYGPFSVGSDPAADKGFTVRDLTLPGGVDNARFERRRTILEAVDSHFRTMEKSDNIDAMDSFYQKAYSLIGSAEAREAFDLQKEDDKMKDRYGRNTAGMRMLLARRLVEAGVRLVTLTYGSWDMHDRIQQGIASQVPSFDQALATLLTDLDERGLLDSTIVMVSSEFGRTPKINKTDGRDHWPKVFSTMLAGGGFKRGFVYGSSDALAAEPRRIRSGSKPSPPRSTPSLGSTRTRSSSPPDPVPSKSLPRARSSKRSSPSVRSDPPLPSKDMKRILNLQSAASKLLPSKCWQPSGCRHLLLRGDF